MINVETKREAGESNSNLIRRFSKKVAAAGILRRAKEARYRSRKPSAFKKKRWALKRLSRTAAIERLKKLGQWQPGKKARRR